MSAILSCTGISKSFQQPLLRTQRLQDHLLHRRHHHRSSMIHALHDVSLSVDTGEWVELTGPNGSGKTTLLKIFANLLQPDRGQIQRRGSIVSFFGIGTGFHPERTCSENIYHYGLLHGQDALTIRALLDPIIEFAGLGSYRDTPVKCLSAGMHKRLGYSAAVHIDADIYLFDEVFSVGDQSFQQQCLSRLSELKSRGASAIVVHHGERSLGGICHRALTLDGGVLVGTPSPVAVLSV